MYRSKHFEVHEVVNEQYQRRYALLRPPPDDRRVLDEFQAEEHADFVAAYCAVFHDGSYEVKARNAAKAALVEGHGQAKLDKMKIDAMRSSARTS